MTGFYDTAKYPWVREIEKLLPGVREEFVSNRDKVPFMDSHEVQLFTGSWRVLPFFNEKAERVDAVHELFPKTSELLSLIPGRIGAAFSMLGPGTEIITHDGYIGGPTTLRIHIPILIPGSGALTALGETREWTPDKCLIFDDSKDHSAYNHSDKDRTVLIVDFSR